MNQKPFTLLSVAGKRREDFPISSWIVVTIDAQEEYRSGLLALENITSAIAEGCRVLAQARALGIPIVHIAHKAPVGAKTFAQDSPMSEIFPEYQVQADESIIAKTLPNAFAGTNHLETIRATGRTHLILFGFMTHMCVSTTARAALDHGLLSTVVANACGTRDLLTHDGSAISAKEVHRVALAEIADRFGFVVTDSNQLFDGV